MSYRILYLTREPHPSFRPDVVTLFGECLPLLGIHSDIVAMQSEQRDAGWSGGDAFTRHAVGRVGKILGRITLAFSLLSLSKKRHYDAIQVRDRVFGAFIGLIVARCRGLPFFYWMSFPFAESWLDLGAGQAANSSPWWRRLIWSVRGAAAAFVLYRIVLPRAQHIFVQSEAMQAMLELRGLAAANMTPVPMGVAIPADLDAIVPVDDERLVGRKVLMYLGALERMRHPEVMLEAMVEVIQKEPTALLVLVGDSQIAADRAWLDGEIRRLNLGRHVLVTGWLPAAQAWRYLRAAQIGLSPFPRTRVLEVASPTKVCEYLAYGIPVVANDQPDQALLLQQTGGGLCVPLSGAGFAQGILKLLGDPALAQAMAATGQLAVAQLRSYKVLSEQLAMQYSRLLGPR